MSVEFVKINDKKHLFLHPHLVGMVVLHLLNYKRGRNEGRKEHSGDRNRNGKHTKKVEREKQSILDKWLEM